MVAVVILVIFQNITSYLSQNARLLLQHPQHKRKEAFEEKDWKPKLKSVLLLGLPGTGKSLSVKCVASIFNWPAIVLDIGATKGGLVGETEKNIRHATKVIDSMGRVIVCVDR